MQCPMTSFDCITCESVCLLERRQLQNDPFRRGNELRTCDAEVAQLGLEEVPAIPAGVYWSREAGNFYDEATNRGMGLAFYDAWQERKDEFPEKATCAPGLDLNLNGPITPITPVSPS